MANLLYPKYKEALLAAGANLSTGVVKVALIDTGAYTYSAAHEFFSSVTGVIGTPVALTTKTITGGVFDADDATFTAVPAGASTAAIAEALIIYLETGGAGTPADDRLIAYFDTATGLPVTPNGGDITIAWDSGANKIFAL